MERRVFSVSELNGLVNDLLGAIPELNNVYVRGEVSNHKAYSSGHHYFTLKDETGSIRCVMFKWKAQALRFRLEDGMKVIAMGRVGIYARDGAYQLTCETVSADGIGDLHVAYEQLKDRLFREGLFDQSHKRPLPRFPRSVAIITSPTGAVIHDMIRNMRRRYPLTKIMLLPVRVQGEEAPAEIAGAIRYANRHHLADVIITGRGGGSFEDLFCFSDERVARAIYASEIPVISAVGHEPDFTIADFVADVRAATPTQAAELVVPDRNDLLMHLENQRMRMLQGERKRLELLRRRLAELAGKRVLTDPLAAIQDKRILLDHIQRDLVYAAQHRLAHPRQQVAALAAALDAMSPLKVLHRGFSLATDQTGAPLRRAEDAPVGSLVDVRLERGRLECRVEKSILEEEET